MKGNISYRIKYSASAKALIVIVILVVISIAYLFLLSPSSGGYLINSTCSPEPGFICSNTAITSAGRFAFIFGLQYNNTSFYNVSLACRPSYAYNYSINSYWISIAILNKSSNGKIYPGQQLYLNNMPCYEGTNSIINIKNQTFDGIIWIKYSTTSSGNTSKVKIAAHILGS